MLIIPEDIDCKISTTLCSFVIQCRIKQEGINKMKKITRQEIVDTVAEVSAKEMETLADTLKRNMEKYEGADFLQGDNRTGFELSIMNTAMQMSFVVMLETLCKLLCDEEK